MFGDRRESDRAPSRRSSPSSRRWHRGAARRRGPRAIDVGERIGPHGVLRVGRRSLAGSRDRSRRAARLSRPNCGSAPRRRRRAARLRPAVRRARARSRTSVRGRAMRATSVLVDAVSWMTPRHSSDRPSIWRDPVDDDLFELGQRRAPTATRGRARRDRCSRSRRASTAGSRSTGRTRRSAGCCQCISAGASKRSTSASTASKGVRGRWRSRGQRRADRAGLDRRHHGTGRQSCAIVGHPIHDPVPERSELLWCHMSSAFGTVPERVKRTGLQGQVHLCVFRLESGSFCDLD